MNKALVFVSLLIKAWKFFSCFFLRKTDITEVPLQVGRDLFCQAEVSNHCCVAVVITFDQAVLQTQKAINKIVTRGSCMTEHDQQNLHFLVQLLVTNCTVQVLTLPLWLKKKDPGCCVDYNLQQLL